MATGQEPSEWERSVEEGRKLVEAERELSRERRELLGELLVGITGAKTLLDVLQPSFEHERYEVLHPFFESAADALHDAHAILGDALDGLERIDGV